MSAKKPAPAARPLCSTCARVLKDGGFRLTYKKDAYLHMEKCSYCGKYLPVHDFTVRGGRRRKIKSDLFLLCFQDLRGYVKKDILEFKREAYYPYIAGLH